MDEPKFWPRNKCEAKVQLKYDKFVFHIGRKTGVFEALGSWTLQCRQKLIAKTDREKNKNQCVPYLSLFLTRQWREHRLLSFPQWSQVNHSKRKGHDFQF